MLNVRQQTRIYQTNHSNSFCFFYECTVFLYNKHAHRSNVFPDVVLSKSIPNTRVPAYFTKPRTYIYRLCVVYGATVTNCRLVDVTRCQKKNICALLRKKEKNPRRPATDYWNKRPVMLISCFRGRRSVLWRACVWQKNLYRNVLAIIKNNNYNTVVVGHEKW